jgi:hypothetical protein
MSQEPIRGQLRVAINYLEALAENLMKLDCPMEPHHPAICPRCQASMQLAMAWAALERSTEEART